MNPDKAKPNTQLPQEKEPVAFRDLTVPAETTKSTRLEMLLREIDQRAKEKSPAAKADAREYFEKHLAIENESDFNDAVRDALTQEDMIKARTALATLTEKYKEK